MEVAASIIAFIDISAKVISLCSEYAKEVKNARPEITRLELMVKGLEKVANDIKKQLDADKGGVLSTSQDLSRMIVDCSAQIGELEKRLDTSLKPDQNQKGKFMRKFGLRALKWPFESSEVNRIIAALEKHNADFSHALQVDQTRMTLELWKRMILETLSPAKSAAFDCYTGPDARCHPETRKDLLQQIREWPENPLGGNIFWLNGVAGTGKSTISRTVAESFRKDNQLGASFCFKRGESERENASKLFTTITSQLLHTLPDLVPHVRSAINKEPEIANKSIDKQFKTLVLQPLQELKFAPEKTNVPPAPKFLVLVIDALDECEGDDDIQLVLALLDDLQNIQTVKIKIFLTSRPELPIRLGFDRMAPGTHEGIILQDVLPPIIEHDISVFIRERFSQIKSNFNIQNPPDVQLSPEWPGDENIKALTEMAIPLFIFAATICRYIGDDADWNPQQKLEAVLKYGTSTDTSQMDRTYLPVLKQLIAGRSGRQIEKYGQEFRKVVGSIAILANPLSTSVLASLLSIPKTDVSSKLHRLHSVLHIPSDPNMPVRLLHLSFREFLVDPDKKDTKEYSWFWIDEAKAHQMILEKCLDVLSGCLKENICGLEHHGVLRKEVTDITIRQHIPEHVQYAATHWVYHLEHSGKTISDGDAVHTFLRSSFLYWIEVLSLLGKIPTCLSMLNTLSLATEETKDVEVSDFLEDTRRFLLQNRGIADRAPLQLYASCLLFSPEMSIVRRAFHDLVPKWVSILPRVPKFWGAELQKIEQPGDLPSGGIAFSPDNKHLALSSIDGTVDIWNLTTGEHSKTMGSRGNHRISKMAYCSEGKTMMTIGINRALRIWNLSSGKVIEESQIDTWSPFCNEFSPDRKQIAYESNSEQYTITIWEIATKSKTHLKFGGEYVYDPEIRYFSGHIKYIAFSPNCRYLAAASRNEIMGLWDIERREPIKKISIHDSSIQGLAFSPDNRNLAFSSTTQDITFWDTTTETIKKLPNSQNYKGIVFSSDGQQLAGIGMNYQIKVWNMTTMSQSYLLKGHTFGIACLCFSFRTKLLASGSWDQTIRLWDTSIRETNEHEGELDDPTTLLEKGRLVSLSNDKLTTKFSDIISRHNKQLLKAQIDTRLVDSVFYSSYGLVFSYEIVGDITGLAIWNLDTGVIKSFTSPEDLLIMEFSLSPDGNHMAIITKGDKLWLLDTVTGKIEGKTEDIERVNSLAFSSDSAYLASDSGDRLVRIWDISTKEVELFEGHSDFVNAVVFSPNGGYLASTSMDKTVRLWNVKTKESKVFKGHSKAVLRVAFSPGGDQLASTSQDETVRLWDVATGSLTRVFQMILRTEYLRFSDNGEYLEADDGVLAIVANPRKTSSHIFVRDGWVNRNGINCIWLPPDYRPRSSDCMANVLAIGPVSGQLNLIGFH